MSRRVSMEQAQTDLSALLDEVARGEGPLVIEQGGQPRAALLSLADLRRLQAGGQKAPARGALALVGAWQDLDDAIIDEMVRDIYETRAADTSRPVDLTD